MRSKKILETLHSSCEMIATFLPALTNLSAGISKAAQIAAELIGRVRATPTTTETKIPIQNG